MSVDRVQFILSTVGEEIKRACAHQKDDRIEHEFTELVWNIEPELIRVDLFWWAPDDNDFIASAYRLSAPGIRNIIPGPGCKTGPYVADGPLPDKCWALEVVVFVGRDDSYLDTLDKWVFATSREGMTKREIRFLMYTELSAYVLR